MVSHCPKCGKEIQDEVAVYCLHCGKPIKETPSKNTGFPVAGGILAIIAACMSIFLGIMGIASFVSSLGYPFYRPEYWKLFMGISGFFAFAFGLTGGIMSLRRENFVLAMVGVCLTMLSGFITIPAFGIVFLTGLLIGISIIILSILSLIFTAVSKTEFS